MRELTHPQRDAGDTRCSNFIDQIVDGGLAETNSIAIATDLVNLEVMTVTTDEDEVINFVFPDIYDVQEFSQRAIITGTNRVVDALNNKILIRLQSGEVSLFSVTWMCSDETRLTNLLSTKFLNSLRTQTQTEAQLSVHSSRLADEQHQSDHERDRPTLDYRRNLNGAQTVRPPSHCVQVHLALELTNHRTTPISTSVVLCHHGEQVTRPNTGQSLC